MGIIQKNAINTSIISYLGLLFGYLNKGVLFIIFLSTEQIGLISLILPVGLLLAQFSNFSSANIIWKFFPFFRDEEKNNFGFLSLNIFLVLIGSFVFSALFWFFEESISNYYITKSPAFVEYYYWILLVSIPTSFYTTFDYYLRAMYKNVLSVFVKDILLRVLTTVFLMLFVYDIISFDLLVQLICFSYIIPMLVLGVYLYKIGEWNASYKKINIHRRFKKIMWSYSLYSYFNMMGALLVVTLDVIMISAYLGLSENGVYSIVLYLTSSLLIPYRSLLRVSAPLISEYWKRNDIGAIDSVYKRISSISLVIGMFGFLIVWINIYEIFKFLPDSFEDGIYIFFFLMLGKVIDAYFGLNGTIVVTSKKFKYDIVFTLILIVLVVLLNVLFIPLWGTIGAAISTSIAYVVYNLLRMIFIWYQYDLKPFTSHQLKVVVLGTFSLLLFYLIPINVGVDWLNILVRSIILIVLFAIAFSYFKIEPEIVKYINKLSFSLKNKFTNK